MERNGDTACSVLCAKLCIFDLPGIGNIALDAMNRGDIPFIMGYNMFVAVLTVIGILLTDIMYAVVDPRVKLGD